jgi:cobalamin biosynthesis protein CobT
MSERNDKGDADRTKNWAEWLAEWSDPNSLKSREERREDEALARQKLMLGQQLAAAVRSLSGHPDIEVRIGSRDRGDTLTVAVEELSQENLPILRGRLDSGALFYRLHDPQVHSAVAPQDHQERRLFELLEIIG